MSWCVCVCLGVCACGRGEGQGARAARQEGAERGEGGADAVFRSTLMRARERGRRCAPNDRPRRGNAQWAALDNDTVLEIFGLPGGRPESGAAGAARQAHARSRAPASQRRLGLSDSQLAVFRAVLRAAGSTCCSWAPRLRQVVPAQGPAATACARRSSPRPPARPPTRSAPWTIHSALGLGLGKQPARQVVAKLLTPSRGTTAAGWLTTSAAATRSLSTRCPCSPPSSWTSRARSCRWCAADLPQFVVSGDPMQLGAVGADTDGAFHDSGLVKGLRALRAGRVVSAGGGLARSCASSTARASGKAREADVAVAARERFAHRWTRRRRGSSAATSRRATTTISSLTSWLVWDCTSTGSRWRATCRLTTSGFARGTRCTSSRARACCSTATCPSTRRCTTARAARCASLAPLSALVDFDAGDPGADQVRHAGVREGRQGRGHAHVHAAHARVGRAHPPRAGRDARLHGRRPEQVLRGGAGVRGALARARGVSTRRWPGCCLHHLNNIDKAALAFYNECAERSEARAERHRERERQAAAAREPG